MKMPVYDINSEENLQAKLADDEKKLVVVNFSAIWCVQCKKIAPLFNELSEKYPNAVFLRIDIDECEDIAMSRNISSFPAFVLYINKVEKDRWIGSKLDALEEKIKQYYTGENSTAVPTKEPKKETEEKQKKKK